MQQWFRHPVQTIALGSFRRLLHLCIAIEESTEPHGFKDASLEEGARPCEVSSLRLDSPPRLKSDEGFV